MKNFLRCLNIQLMRCRLAKCKAAASAMPLSEIRAAYIIRTADIISKIYPSVPQGTDIINILKSG